jgi:ABC-type multidrug transport system ATPase subunit
MSSISISHLSKTYGKTAAVDDFSLEIPSGCVFGLLGPNGAGKTTTFKCILDLARANAGEVRFDGKTLEPHMFERIAYIPERSVLYDWMTVADHVEMTRRAFERFSLERALELLAQFDIDSRKKARALSKGMRTAVAVALAFARRPDVLVLDEPTSGLDPINQRAVLNLIVNESARGCTILFSSHQIGQVERAAERIAVMQRGRLALEGSVDDLKAGWKIVEGIMPSEDASINGIASDARIRRLDRNGRIVRALVRDGSDSVADSLTAIGAGGVRVVDLNLEDIFINAVDPTAQTADYVEGA